MIIKYLNDMHNIVYKILLIMLFSVSYSSFAQNRIADPICIARGSCFDIYKKLKENNKNDSVAVVQLINNYVFENKITFKTNQWKLAFAYITKKDNKNVMCFLKSDFCKDILLHE